MDIPLDVLTVVTGVAGSGKSTLIRGVFASVYAGRVVLVDQSPVTATGRSTPATYLGFFDEIRRIMAAENGVDAALFSFNSKGACPACGGRGATVTELAFMDPVTTVCEVCEGKRYSAQALSYLYKAIRAKASWAFLICLRRTRMSSSRETKSFAARSDVWQMA